MNKPLKYILFLLSFLPVIGLSGCKGDEDALTPSEPVSNPYEVPSGATGLDAELRRKFFNDHGCYLLFSTELNGSTGGTLAGNELEDLRWNLTSFDNSGWVLTTFDTDEEKQQAYDVIENTFMPHIDPSKLPYSIFPVKEYYTTRTNGTKYRDIVSKKVFRCTAYNIGKFIDLDTEGREEAFRDMVYNIIKKDYSSYSDEMQPFYVVSEEYYDNYCAEYYPDWLDMSMDERLEAVNQLGFLSYDEDWYDESEYDEIRDEDGDINDFAEAVLYTDPEDFYEQWDGYDIIIKKYEIMKRIIAEEVGFIF